MIKWLASARAQRCAHAGAEPGAVARPRAVKKPATQTGAWSEDEWNMKICPRARQWDGDCSRRRHSRFTTCWCRHLNTLDVVVLDRLFSLVGFLKWLRSSTPQLGDGSAATLLQVDGVHVPRGYLCHRGGDWWRLIALRVVSLAQTTSVWFPPFQDAGRRLGRGAWPVDSSARQTARQRIRTRYVDK